MGVEETKLAPRAYVTSPRRTNTPAPKRSASVPVADTLLVGSILHFDGILHVLVILRSAEFVHIEQ